MAKVYRVALTADERAELEALVRKGTGAALRLTRARILLRPTKATAAPPGRTRRWPRPWTWP
jgi:hypothetical protein